MVIFPVLVLVFFTSMMKSGVPQDLPIAVVDQDNTSTTRSLIRTLDAFQSSEVVAHYSNPAEARNAIQRNQIYGFLYIPKGTTDGLLSQRQPKISFYYSNTTLSAGGMVYKDLKTIATLGSAAVGKATMQAKGFTDEQIMAFLQPIKVDAHLLNNPWVSYNSYLSTFFIPGCILLFVFLITPYSIGTELKFNRSKEWIAMADGNMFVALTGKLLPQFLIFAVIMFGHYYYTFGVLHFPHPGGALPIALLGILSVLAAQGLRAFFFGLLPSLRMSMSISSLWAVLSFTTGGGAFPVFAMDTPIEALSYLFPMRHYYMIYQICVFNGYSLSYAWLYVVFLVAFACLPMLVLNRIRKAMIEYEYIP